MKIDQCLMAISRAFVRAYDAHKRATGEYLQYEVFTQDQLRQAVPLLREIYDAHLAADTSELAIRVKEFLEPYGEKGGREADKPS